MSAVRDRLPRSRGFTLFEVLIAFFIISIGLVGVVSLQAMSKAAQHQAVQRSRAVTLADQMLEMIRGNPRGVVRYNIGASAVGGGSIADQPTPNCISAACDPNQMAEALDPWVCPLTRQLPVDPVTAEDGHVYERSAISSFIRRATASSGIFGN